MTTADGVTAVAEFAPAKVNLTLHVTGQRGDGYHELDSLVVFADVGDRVTVKPARNLQLRVTGPFAAGVPADESNLVLRAAHIAGITGADILLDKNLPSAAGIGGGSSDAAAFLRAATRSHGLGKVPLQQALSLGADVPMCMRPQAARVSGVGERIAPVQDLPDLPAVLVNPGIAVPTAGIFRNLVCKSGAGMSECPTNCNLTSFFDWLRQQRNDLETPAMGLAPVIADVLADLLGEGAVVARMSGSGATCFGLFERLEDARSASDRLARANPGFWVQATVLK